MCGCSGREGEEVRDRGAEERGVVADLRPLHSGLEGEHPHADEEDEAETLVGLGGQPGEARVPVVAAIGLRSNAALEFPSLVAP